MHELLTTAGSAKDEGGAAATSNHHRTAVMLSFGVGDGVQVVANMAPGLRTGAVGGTCAPSPAHTCAHTCQPHH
eukprot:480055-Alexandrium_andersonii.AAC.1